MFMLAWHHREKTTKPERQRARNQKTHVTGRILLMARTKKLSVKLNLKIWTFTMNQAHNAKFSRAPKARRVEGEARNELELFVNRLLLLYDYASHDCVRDHQTLDY